MHRINYPILALIIANIIWGAASPIFKYSLQNIPPFSLAYLRFLIACLLLYPFVHKHLHYYDLKNKWLWAFAICAVPINISLFFLALQRTASINAPIIGSAGPIFILIGSLVFLRERVRASATVGTIVSLLGVVVIIARPILEHGLSVELVGNLLLIGATLGAVGQVLIGRKILTTANAVVFTFWSFLIGTVYFLPFALREYISNPAWMLNLDQRGWTGILFGGLLSSTAAYTLYNWAITKLPAFRLGVFTYLDPVIAIIIAMPLLGEKITPPFILGSILVFVGILIAERRIHYHPIHKLLGSSD